MDKEINITFLDWTDEKIQDEVIIEGEIKGEGKFKGFMIRK